MGAVNSKSRIAGGTINPFTFIQANPGVELGALQCSGPGVEIIGVGAEWTNAMMGTQVQTSLVPQGFPAATTGQGIRVYEDGEDTIMMVGSGYTVMPDNLLVSDASGNAVPINLGASRTTAQWIGARAIEAGVAGDVIRVSVYTRPF
jgi:hypothetical protein